MAASGLPALTMTLGSPAATESAIWALKPAQFRPMGHTTHRGRGSGGHDRRYSDGINRLGSKGDSGKGPPAPAAAA